jgi:hypothetical protein
MANQRRFATWGAILDYNATMVASDYPSMQMDETTDVLYAIATLRIYFSALQGTKQAKRTDATSVFRHLRRSELLTYIDSERKAVCAALQTNQALLGGHSVHSYMAQLPPFDSLFPEAGAAAAGRVTLRELLGFVKRTAMTRPRRLIELEGLPLLAAPRLQLGGEWYGELTRATAVAPNFVDRLADCRYLIEIGGARRFVTYEDPENDGKCSCGGGAERACVCPDRSASAAGSKRTLRTLRPVRGFVDQENLAWNVACAVWRFQETALAAQPYTGRVATFEELVDWLSGRCALFREGPLRKSYLAAAADSSKGHLFAAHARCRYEPPAERQFKNIPIVDYTAPTQRDVFRMLRHTGLMGPLRGKVFMHCAGGWGRTGMGLLLSIMVLHDVDWDAAMKIMYQTYKRQSIEEVHHLLHASACALYGKEAKRTTQKFISTSKQGAARSIKQHFGQAVPYHALVIPQFRSWIKRYAEERAGGHAKAALSIAKVLRCSRPAARHREHVPDIQYDIRDARYQGEAEHVDALARQIKEGGIY